MLFQKRFWPGIAEGAITVAFRRWKRLQVVPGNRYRTPGGIIQVEAVDVVDPGAISEADATAAGHASSAEVLASLAPSESLPTYRIAFHRVAGADPRDELASRAELTAEDRAAIAARLGRLDGAGQGGPWTRTILGLVAANPAVRAGDLAPRAGMDLLPFKLNVRKLKNLGLTLSLGTGYRLSPRGEAFLAEDRGND